MRKVRKKEKDKSKKWGSIWNPKNLQKEVHAFGYDFQWKTYLLTFVCVLLLMAVVAIFFKLKTEYVTVIGVLVLVMLPIFIVDMYKRMYEQKRFADVTDYMEQVLYAFRKNQNTMQALKECEDAMPEGMMKQTVNEAVSYLETGIAKTEKGVLSEALELIENAYRCRKIHTVHELLISAEDRGGDAERSIELLLEDIEVWKRQVYRLQSNKKKSHVDNILSIIVAALLCGFDMYLMELVKGMAYAGEDVSIFNLMTVQITSFVFLILCLITFYKSTRRLTGDWLEKDKSGEKSILQSYRYVKRYDEKKERRKSLFMALPFLIISIPCYVWLSKILSVICVLLAVFMLVQHRFSYNMSMKEVQKALYMAFPEWMMDIALLLQTNNVQVAIRKSMEKADALIAEELKELVECISEEPDDIQSYTAFCERFIIPEITSCMKMLYSISESGSGNADVQIENLMRHLHQFQEKEADMRNKDIVFKMHMLFFYPVVGTSVKLMVDMTVGTLLVFQLFGSF